MDRLVRASHPQPEWTPFRLLSVAGDETGFLESWAAAFQLVPVTSAHQPAHSPTRLRTSTEFHRANQGPDLYRLSAIRMRLGAA